MPTLALELEGLPTGPIRRAPRRLPPERQARIGSGVALAANGGSRRWRDNPHHWQTLIFLLPRLYNPLPNGFREPIPIFLMERTLEEMQVMFSGYTLSPAHGWYLDGRKGVPDDLVRFEVDGIFTGGDLRVLHEWKKKLCRRFRQKYIYMRLVSSGVAV